MACDVEVPLRVLRRAAHRCDDEVVVAVLTEDERRGARLAAAATGRGQQQRGDAVPQVADLAVGLAVGTDVLGAEQGDVRALYSGSLIWFSSVSSGDVSAVDGQQHAR